MYRTSKPYRTPVSDFNDIASPKRSSIQKERSESKTAKASLTAQNRTHGKAQKTPSNHVKSIKRTRSRRRDIQNKESESQHREFDKSRGNQGIQKKRKQAKRRGHTQETVDSAARHQARHEASNKHVYDDTYMHVNMNDVDVDVDLDLDDLDDGGTDVVQRTGGRAKKKAKKKHKTIEVGQFKIRVFKPKIDALAFVLQADDDDQIRICKAVRDLVSSQDEDGSSQDENDTCQLKEQRYTRGTRYRENHAVFVDDKRVAMFQFDPLDKANAFMRVKFNPAKLNPSTRRAVVQSLRAILSDRYDSLMGNAKITVLHIAIDIGGVPMSALMYFSNRVVNSGVWGYSWSRHNLEKIVIKTQRIGSEKSATYIVVYDKRDELRDNEGIDLGEERVRIEGRAKASVKTKGLTRPGVYLHELHKMVNPLNNINVSVFPDAGVDNRQFQIYLYATRQVGTDAVVALIEDPRERTRFRQFLASKRVDWWQPDKFFVRAIEALKALDIFPASAFEPKEQSED